MSSWEGASPPKELTKLKRHNAVEKPVAAACATDIPIHAITASILRKVPHAGFAAIQDDIRISTRCC